MANKKGGITQDQLGWLVLAIGGLLIVLWLIGDFGSGGFVEDEICKLSVLTRATAPDALQGAIPLKCKTQKVCLSDGSGDCNEFIGEEHTTEKLSGQDIEKIREIEEQSAKMMYGCWNMLGQGKLDLYGKFSENIGLSSSESTCVVCGRLAFHDVDQKILEDVNLNDYLKETKVPGSELTYLQTFTDKSFVSYPEISENIFNENVQQQGVIGSAVDQELAFVFMQIKTENYEDVFRNLVEAGFAVSGPTFLTPGIGTLATKAILSGPGLIAAGIGTVALPVYAAHNVHQGKVAAAGYCGPVTTNYDESKDEGCSVIQVMPYDVENINRICKTVQGLP